MNITLGLQTNCFITSLLYANERQRLNNIIISFVWLTKRSMFCLVGIYESLGIESSITRKIMSAHTQRCFLSENSIIFVIVLRFCSDCSFIVILTTKRADISCFIPPQLPPLPLHLFRSGIYEQAKANVLSKFKLLNLRFIIILLVGFFFCSRLLLHFYCRIMK